MQKSESKIHCANSQLGTCNRRPSTEQFLRVDLSGKDVARKLLVLARELGLEKEFEEITIQDLVPPHLNGQSTLKDFQKNKKDLDPLFLELKKELKPDEVIRHVGERTCKPEFWM